MPYTHEFYNMLRKYRREFGNPEASDIAMKEASQLGIPMFRERKEKQMRFKKQKGSDFGFFL